MGYGATIPPDGPRYLMAITEPSTLVRLHDETEGHHYTLIVEPPEPYAAYKATFQWVAEQLPTLACRKIQARDDRDLDYARWYQYLYRYRSIDFRIQKPGQAPVDSYTIVALPCANHTI